MTERTRKVQPFAEVVLGRLLLSDLAARNPDLKHIRTIHNDNGGISMVLNWRGKVYVLEARLDD